jgi:hypothetical protein
MAHVGVERLRPRHREHDRAERHERLPAGELEQADRVVLILRADNRGGGGVLALGTLASRAVPRTKALLGLVLALTIGGLALFYRT